MARGVTAIMHRVRPHEDHPEPAAIFRRSVRPQDAPDAAVAVEHVVVVVRPLTARAAFGAALEGQLRTTGSARCRSFRRSDLAIVARYLAQSDAPKLHIGCGGHVLTGWLNPITSLNYLWSCILMRGSISH